MQGSTMQDPTQWTIDSSFARYLRLPASLGLLLIGSLLLIALQGCVSLASSRNSAPLVDAEVGDGLPMSIRTLGADHRYTQQSSADIASRLEASTPGEPINILALSGGAAGGAFGAGAIVGLTLPGDRPPF